LVRRRWAAFGRRLRRFVVLAYVVHLRISTRLGG
jgi:hypothetical protein